MHRFVTTTLLFFACLPALRAVEPATPVFKDGEAQIVEEFKDSDFWVRHDLWVETEFDSDGDGKLNSIEFDVFV